MLTLADAEAFEKAWEKAREDGQFQGDFARKAGMSRSAIDRWKKDVEFLLGRKLEALGTHGSGGKRFQAALRAERLARLTGEVTPTPQATPGATFPPAGVANGEQPRTVADTSHPTKPVRHIVIPDTQIRKGVPIDHIAWIGQYIAEHGADVVVMLGDWYDFPSLSTHDEPGSLSKEGARYSDDLNAGNAALKALTKHLGNVPRRVMLRGNHEDRLRRTLEADPKWVGSIDEHQLVAEGWEIHAFQRVVEIDGVYYSHYFQNEKTSRPIGGSLDNRINKICASFVVGHEQGLLLHRRPLPIGRTIHAVVAGSGYLHAEGYRGAQRNNDWRGIVVLNDVKDGDFDTMPVSMAYLCRRYTGEELVPYMQKRYPADDWTHLRR